MYVSNGFLFSMSTSVWHNCSIRNRVYYYNSIDTVTIWSRPMLSTSSRTVTSYVVTHITFSAPTTRSVTVIAIVVRVTLYNH